MSQEQISVELSLALQEFYANLMKLQTDFGSAMKGMGSSASDGGEQVDAAFKALGTRSIDSIRYEIKALEQAFDTLKTSGTVSVQDIARAESVLQSKVASLNAELERGGAVVQDVGREIQSAFGVLGVRSVETIRSEISALEKAFLTLKTSGTASAEDIARAETALQAKVAALNAEIAKGQPAVQDAGLAIQEAFGTLGVRSVESIQKELATLQQAFSTLKTSGTASAEDIARAQHALQIKVADLNAEIGRGQPAAVNTGKAIQEAFGVVGVRSAAQIQTEIREIDVALQKLGMDTHVSGQEFDRAWGAGQAKLAGLQAELNGAGASANLAASGAKGLGTNMGALGGIASSVGPMIVAAFGAQHFIEVNTQAESLRRCLVQLTGSQQTAGAEMDYIRGAANRMGMEVQTAASSYMSLMASTRGTALEGEQTRRIFEAVAGAMGMMGKSSAETNNALNAVSQMASKGTVQMEELRGQLGEALPGALQAAASGMGVTTQKLIEMVSSGDVLAKDLLPRLADGLEKTYGTTGKVESFAAAWNRLKNSLDGVMTNIGQSGVMTTLANGLDYLAVKVSSAWLGVETLGKGMGILAGAAVTLTNPLKALGEMLDENKKKAALGGETFGKQGAELDELRKKYGLTQVEIDKLNGKQAASVSASDAAAQAAAKTANAENSRAASAQKVTEALRESVAQTERASKASATYAEAVKQSGANAVAVAQMFGSEAEARAASAKAAEDYAVAVKKDLANQEQLLASKRMLLTQLQEEANKSGELSQKKQEEIKSLEDGIATQTAAVAKAKELAEASDMAARKSELAAETYGNQSSHIEEYAKAMEVARQRVEELKAAESAGAATKEQVKAATLDLGEATARYRDALNDATQAASLHVQQLGRQASLEQAQLGVVKSRYQAIYEVAKAQGREREAAEAMAAIRKIEIQIQEAQAKAARAQAAAIITVAKSKEAELAASGKLTEAAKAEIDARIQEAEVKKLEAEKAEILAGKLKELAELEGDVRDRGKGAADGLRNSLGGAADASDRLNASLRNRPGGGGGGGGGEGVGSGGNGKDDKAPSSASFIPNPGAPSLSKTEKSGPAVYSGLQTDWEKIARTDGLRGEEVTEYMKIIGGLVKDEEANALGGFHEGDATYYGDAMAGAFKSARVKAAEQARLNVQRAKNTASSSSSSSQGQSSYFPGQSTVQHTVNLTINGKSTPVNVSSEDDAKALLSALSTAAGVSS